MSISILIYKKILNANMINSDIYIMFVNIFSVIILNLISSFFIAHRFIRINLKNLTK